MYEDVVFQRHCKAATTFATLTFTHTDVIPNGNTWQLLLKVPKYINNTNV